MFKNKNNFIILGLIITIIIVSGTNLSKVNYDNNLIHLFEFHKFDFTTDFKTESSVFSNQTGEATVSDWDRLLNKVFY